MAGKNPLEIQRLEEKLLNLNGINELAQESSSDKIRNQLKRTLQNK